MKTAPVFEDEVGWIAASSREADLAIAGQFDWNLWNARTFGPYGPLNPPLGKLSLGLPLRVGDTAAPFVRKWDLSLSYADNLTQGNIPSPDLLLRGRKIAAVHSALFVVIVCALGWEVGGAGVGLLAAALLCFHPTWRLIGSRVFTDMLLSALLLAMALPAIRWLRKPTEERGFSPLLLMALLAGAAGAVKPTGSVLGLMFMSSVVIVRAIHIRKVKGPLVGAAMAALIFGAALVAFDPWLWPNPTEVSPKSIPREMGVALELMEAQSPLGALERGADLMPSLHALFRPALILVRANHWRGLVSIQRSLPSLQWHRPRLLELMDWIALSFVSFPGEVLFMLVGAWLALSAAYHGLRSGRFESTVPMLVFLLFTATALAYTFALVVLPVPRYLLPLFALLQLLAAFGIVGIIRLVVSRLRFRASTAVQGVGPRDANGN